MEHKASEELQRRMWVAQCLPCEPALLFILCSLLPRAAGRVLQETSGSDINS